MCVRTSRARQGKCGQPQAGLARRSDGLRSSRMARVLARIRSRNTEFECPKESARQFSKWFRYEARTKRHSPLSLNGLVVNHSHMNALVLPSFTESISPRMSLFTTNIDVRDKEEIRRIQVVSARSSGCLRWVVACTFEVNSLRVPALLESHYECHGLAPALHKNVISEAVYLKSVEVPNTFRVSRCQQWSPLSHR